MSEPWTDPSGAPIEFYLYVLPTYALLAGLAAVGLLAADRSTRYPRRHILLAVGGVFATAGLLSLAGFVWSLNV